MKLRNKKTGEIGCLIVAKGSDYYTVASDELDCCGKYDTLSDLNEEWEDYEEPKGIQDVCNVKSCVFTWMGSEEEAEKAVEKIKAWKRLKDRGFQFESWFGGTRDISFWLDAEIDEDIAKDLDLLFGGKE